MRQLSQGDIQRTDAVVACAPVAAVRRIRVTRMSGLPFAIPDGHPAAGRIGDHLYGIGATPLEALAALAAVTTPVINIARGASADAVYIGRAGHGESGYFGNPVVRGRLCSRCGAVHGDNGATLPCFLAYATERIANDPEYAARVGALHGRTLACFCAPRPCHGYVLRELAAQLTYERKGDDA